MNNYSKRIVFIDLAKGICILMVVLLHTDASVYEVPNFDALRMPFYFMLSGFFFKNYEVKKFLIKKINNILIPLLFWMLLFDLWNVWYCQFKVDFAIVHFFKNPFYRFIDCNPALWFLICLFITNVLFYCIHFCFKKNLWIPVVFLGMIGYWLFVKEIKLPLWTDSTLSALPFFFLGYFSQNLSFLLQKVSYKKDLILGFLFVGFAYSIYFLFNRASICIGDNTFKGFPLLGYANSMSFIIGVFMLCKIINWLPIVSYFGKYSIIILCIHFPILIFLPRMVSKYLSYNMGTGELTVTILVICWISIPICKKILPYVVAQKPFLKIPQ